MSEHRGPHSDAIETIVETAFDFITVMFWSTVIVASIVGITMVAGIAVGTYFLCQAGYWEVPVIAAAIAGCVGFGYWLAKK